MAAAILLGTLLAGCAALGPGPEGISARGEAAFREQNRLSSELMMWLPVLESTEPARAKMLLDAEQRMLEACAPLNRIAALRRDGVAPGLGDRLAASASLSPCEDGAAELAASMNRER